MEDKAKCGHSLYWHNCYKGSHDLLTGNSMSHPAKMSPKLCFHILEHLEELGLASPERDTILDPMAGTGLTAICAGAKGYKAVTVELEQKFIDMCQTYLCPGVVHYSVEERILPAVEAGWVISATGGLDENGELEYKPYYTKALPERKRYVVTASSRCGNREWHPVHRVIGNKQYAERKLYKSLDWQILKGDSRRLSELLKGQGLKSVVSPPYESSLNNTAEQKGWDKLANDPTSSRYGRKSIPSVGAEYSANPDNIGNLKDTPLKSITSPPYQDSQGHPSLGSVNKDDWGKEGKDIVKRRGLSGEYGETEGQVGNLKSITSPPYEESLPNGLDRKAAEQMVQAMYDKHGRTYSKEDFEYQVELILKRSNREYGDAEGQIGKLKDKPLKAITSPPYADQQLKVADDYHVPITGNLKSKGTDHLVANAGYETDGQIANLKDTPLKAITSPPYIDGKKGEIDAGKFATHMENTDDWGDRHTEGRMKGIKSMGSGYSEDKENIGNLKDKPLKSITSPPYQDSEIAIRLPSGADPEKRKGLRADGNWDGYGESDGQIGRLKDKPLKSIVSPPYGETGVGDWKTGRAEFQAWVINEIKTKGYVEWQGKRYSEAEWRAMNHGRIDGRSTKGVHKHPTDGYSDNPDNIGGLPDKPLKSLMSPPYGDAEKRDRSKEASNEKEKDYARGDHNISAGYQGSDDNIGKLADKPLKSVMSPPHGLGKGTGHADKKRDTRPILKDRNVNLAYNDENPDNIGNLADKPLKSIVSPPYDKNVVDRYDRVDDNRLHKEKGIAMNYGRSEGQVAQEGQESYLSAMSKVYREISLVADVLCVVVKNPTRNGKLRRLDLDTIAILEASNWKVHCQHRALLFEELEQADMFEGSKKQVKGRLSFFKRLSWQNGNPVASWEDIIICTRK